MTTTPHPTHHEPGVQLKFAIAKPPSAGTCVRSSRAQDLL